MAGLTGLCLQHEAEMDTHMVCLKFELIFNIHSSERVIINKLASSDKHGNTLNFSPVPKTDENCEQREKGENVMF
jgi:hypothetical protein